MQDVPSPKQEVCAGWVERLVTITESAESVFHCVRELPGVRKAKHGGATLDGMDGVKHAADGFGVRGRALKVEQLRLQPTEVLKSLVSELVPQGGEVHATLPW
jgi:hypothetical protein